MKFKVHKWEPERRGPIYRLKIVYAEYYTISFRIKGRRERSRDQEGDQTVVTKFPKDKNKDGPYLFSLENFYKR